MSFKIIHYFENQHAFSGLTSRIRMVSVKISAISQSRIIRNYVNRACQLQIFYLNSKPPFSSLSWLLIFLIFRAPPNGANLWQNQNSLDYFQQISIKKLSLKTYLFVCLLQTCIQQPQSWILCVPPRYNIKANSTPNIQFHSKTTSLECQWRLCEVSTQKSGHIQLDTLERKRIKMIGLHEIPGAQSSTAKKSVAMKQQLRKPLN